MQTITVKQYSPRSVTLLGFVAMVLLWGSFPVAAKIGGFFLVMLGCVLVEM